MQTDYALRRFTVDEYLRMAEGGVFAPGERVELLDGEIVAMPPMNDPHIGSLGRANRTLVLRLAERAIVLPQAPIRTSDRSMPEPDFQILRSERSFYATRGATPSDVIALVEISDASLRYDRGPKLREYARAGIADYWIVNVPDDRVEIFRRPADLGFAERIVLRRGESAVFLAFPDDRIFAEELLPGSD